MPAFSSIPRATGAMKSTHGCRMKSTFSCWMSCVTAAEALATSEPSSLVMGSMIHLPSMPPWALVCSIAPMVEPTMAWFGAALTPVAELTNPTLMVPPSVAAGDEASSVVPESPQPPKATAAATMTTSAISATAIHLRLLITPPCSLVARSAMSGGSCLTQVALPHAVVLTQPGGGAREGHGSGLQDDGAVGD